MRVTAFDRFAASVSPKWGMGRLRNKAAFMAFGGSGNDTGYIVPGSPKKSMKGVSARARSADADINGKLPGMRAISRDLVMNSPLAASMLRRKKTTIINSGLQVQARVDRDVLGISEEEAQAFETRAEKEFALWAESIQCDYDEQLYFGEMQGVSMTNMFGSGDHYFILPYVEPTADMPYGTRIKMIDADLVRNPRTLEPTKDIEAGVEKDKRGRVVAIHVWNCYEYEQIGRGTIANSIRIPVYNAEGRRQIFQVADFERIGQRRGVPLFAPAVEPLKQLTRLSEAQLMNALISAYFSVFVRDMSGMGNLMNGGFTPSEAIYGGGVEGPNAVPESKTDGNENDIELGIGNINYLDENTDISIADPKKVDTGFQAFWEALGNQVTAVGGIPFEQAMIKYTTSYTAARAALLDGWKETLEKRALISRRFCSVCYEAVIEEAIIRGRMRAPKFFDDPIYRKAWLGSYWVGIGMGSIDPLKSAKATQFSLATMTSTYEDEYMERTGGRWDAAMVKRSREMALLKSLGLKQEELTETLGAQVEKDEDEN